AMHELGVSGLRLRWPNDLLVDDRKLAGLLIDHFASGLAVIGIGLNVRNQPDAIDPALKSRIARLLDILEVSASRRLAGKTRVGTYPAPSLQELTQLVLRHVQIVLTGLQELGAKSIFNRVNQLWGGPRRVELDLDETLRRGLFTGVDEQGRLVLE